ncbi:hypothetical protein A6770_13875 [Nostoc minutum NIES-26]|uniref:Uncharacterized protein n=1 Tax=Nostoc minutum NIES-26 TaxID=1844469 RepID=A0A367RMT0_9NOSO|nr:hypothetical protein A6770_13875 [Nostoc minutum NIES-26]
MTQVTGVSKVLLGRSKLRVASCKERALPLLLQKSQGRVLVGLRQKVARKNTQIYIQTDFDIVQPSFLIYLGFKHF